MNASGISGAGLGLRIIAALALVLLTYNPTQSSYFHWALRDFSDFGAVKAFPGAVLLAGWVLFARAAFSSLGPLGLVLTSLVIGCLVWLLSDWGILDSSRPGVLAWVSLVALGVILGIGVSWSHLRRRFTGQIDVDEIRSS